MGENKKITKIRLLCRWVDIAYLFLTVQTTGEDGDSPPAAAQDEASPPAAAEDGDGPPAAVQFEAGPPAAAQDEDGPPAAAQDKDGWPSFCCAAQDDDGPHVAAQDKDGPLAAAQDILLLPPKTKIAFLLLPKTSFCRRPKPAAAQDEDEWTECKNSRLFSFYLFH